jgi:hypothetical protein
MRTVLWVIVLLVLVLCTTSPVADYAQADRRAARVPAYQQAPKYALLVFGKEARPRVLVALDGPTVCLDRNAGGDLTAPAEQFARLQDCRGVEINDPDGKTRYRINHLLTFTDKKQAREWLYVDVDINGPLSYHQYAEVELCGSAGGARVAHFHGPLKVGPVTVNGQVPAGLALVAGATPVELQAQVGTIDSGQGSRVVVRAHKGDAGAAPPSAFPVVDVEFPSPAPGGPPVRKRYALDTFC